MKYVVWDEMEEWKWRDEIVELQLENVELVEQ